MSYNVLIVSNDANYLSTQVDSRIEAIAVAAKTGLRAATERDTRFDADCPVYIKDNSRRDLKLAPPMTVRECMTEDARRPTTAEVIEWAELLVGGSDARLCLADAKALRHDRPDDARRRALSSLAYSVGVHHPAYRRAAMTV